MSLLFNRPKSLQVRSSFKADPAKEGLDTVLVGSTIWDKLTPTQNAKPGYKCISVRSLNFVQDSGLVAWAVLDDEIDGIAIPPSWIHEHPHIFHRNDLGSSLLRIASTEPVLLSEVVVSALTQESYDVARHSNLEARLTNEHTVLRHGSILSLDQSSMLVNGNGHNAPSKTYRYRLNMLEPVLQGYAQKGATQFIITAPLPGEEDAEEDDQEEADFNEDEVEIGEDFLASSVISPPLALSTTPELDHEADGHGVGTLQDQSTGLHLESRPLRRPPSQKADENTVYVRTSDLGKLGLLNGDWGMARSSHRSTGRLVRVVADDKIVPNSGLVYGSPVLLHNICSKNMDTPRSEPATISLFPSPFGSQQPTIPTARTVTLARVASPFSVNKKYQAAFLGALKTYFSQGRRLVKQGDIIAVGIDTNNLPVENTEGESSNEGEIHSLSGFPASVNETVFFCVTNVEHDVIKTNASPDVYLSATIGELGCWIVADETRMMQTGIEHCLVPDVTSYTSSRGATLPILRGLGTSNLLGPDSSYQKMMELVSAALGTKAVDYNLELSMLLKGARGIGKFTTLSWVAQDLGMHLLEVNCYDLIGENDTKSEASLRFQFEKAQDCSPCILVLRHLEAFVQSTQPLEPGKEPVLTKALQECIQETPKGWKMTGYPVITVGTASEPGRIPAGILALFKHEISFEAPGEGARLEMLQCLVDNTALAPDVALSEIATHTAALVAADIVDLISRAHSASIERVLRAGNTTLPHLVDAGVALNADDFDVALGKARAAYSDSIGAPKIPNVSWDDVGGLANVKSEILDTIQLPLDHPELFADGLKKRSGILLYGPPGTGKTLLAKAVATSCALNFFSVKGPELLNMYIGESEANVRRVFQRARDAKPCVVFFDELDSIAPKRGNQGDSGGVMDRIVSQLLAEIDGMSSGSGSSDVFVIGATNRPDLLDPALLRPGRFDRMLYLGVSDTHEAQANILRALTRKFRLHSDLDLDQVAEQCPFNYTGADFYALCSDAMLNAMSRKAEMIDEKIATLKASGGHPHTLTPQYYLAEMATPEEIEVLVTREDFDRALKALVPSVSQAEMDHYARVRDEFSKDKKEENTTH